MTATPRRIQPYRLLFPLGLTYGVIGAGLWPVHALGGISYPGFLHRLLMIQGFEQSFVLGFLLTAMPGLTKGSPCHPLELCIAVVTMLILGIGGLLGQLRLAELAFVASIVLLLVAVARRMTHANPARPTELWFVGFGLVLGLLGGIMQFKDPSLNVFAERLVSLGMVLSMVLGLGSLLVPTFIGMRAPLEIPRVAAAHGRQGRAALYASLIGALSTALVAEALGQDILGAFIRAVAATIMILLVWKLFRPPGRRDAPAFAMWSAGWFMLVGLWAAALAPRFALGALHIVFIGGFALLTAGIGTRVVVTHGQYPLEDERRVLSPPVATTLILALLIRLAAEFVPARAIFLLGLGGGLWVAAWLVWALNAVPRLRALGRSAVAATEPRD